MKYLMASVLLILALATTANAAECTSQINNISGLDKLTKQAMIVDCESTKLATQEAAAQPAFTQDERIEMAEKWAEVAKQFVGAMALVAEEMGKTVNEFLPTPAGMLTAALITWQVMGDSISGAIGSALQAAVAIFFIVIVSAFCKNMRHCETKDVTTKGFMGERTKRVKCYTPVADLRGDNAVLFNITYIIGTLIGILVLYFSF